MNQGLKFESRPSSEIEINPEIITLNERASIHETSWDTMERWDAKIHHNEHPHKCDVDIQTGKKLMVAKDLGGWKGYIWNLALISSHRYILNTKSV